MKDVHFAKVSHETVGRWSAYHSAIGDYMDRWILNTPFGTLRVHHILRSDEARALHDHPWDFWSFLLSGGYTEVVPCGDCGEEKRVWHPRFSIVRKKAEDKHRLVLDHPVWTLVWSGPPRRKWGFDIPDKGWTYWRDAEAFWAGKAE